VSLSSQQKKEYNQIDNRNTAWGNANLRKKDAEKRKGENEPYSYLERRERGEEASTKK